MGMKKNPTRRERRIPLTWFCVALLFGVAAALSSCQRTRDMNRIVIWHQMRVEDRLVLEDQLRQFMAEHPGVTVEQIFKETEELRSGFIVAAIAGQGPDLVYGAADQVGPFEVMDIIKPLEGMFEKKFLDSFIPQAITFYKGHLYQLPDKLGNHLTLIYNRDMLSTPPATDLELIRDGQRLTKDLDGDGRTDQYGLAWNYTEPYFFIPFMTGFGGWVLDDAGNPALDSKGTINGLKFIRDLRDVYKIIPGEADYNIADAMFKDGKSAMIINGDWSWAGYKKAGVNFGVAILPKITSTGLWCAPMVSPRGFSMNINVPEEKQALVVELLKFLMRPDLQMQSTRELWSMPTRKEAAESEFVKKNDILRNSALQIQHGRLLPMVPEMRAIWDAMRPSYQAVLGGSKTPEQAAHDMQDLALRKIKEMNE
jgi:arabinogalactan oligomer/maltooligosaccharide transport system permease protein